jgi:hypothetical protein
MSNPYYHYTGGKRSVRTSGCDSSAFWICVFAILNLTGDQHNNYDIPKRIYATLSQKRRFSYTLNFPRRLDHRLLLDVLMLELRKNNGFE